VLFLCWNNVFDTVPQACNLPSACAEFEHPMCFVGKWKPWYHRLRCLRKSKGPFCFDSMFSDRDSSAASFPMRFLVLWAYPTLLHTYRSKYTGLSSNQKPSQHVGSLLSVPTRFRLLWKKYVCRNALLQLKAVGMRVLSVLQIARAVLQLIWRNWVQLKCHLIERRPDSAVAITGQMYIRDLKHLALPSPGEEMGISV